MYSKVLVVGGAGYVGSAITKLHLQNGSKVMVFDNFSSSTAETLPLEDENLVIVKGTITDKKSILSAVSDFQPEVVFHMAAVHYIPQCIKDPQVVIDTNITGTLNVVDALNQQSVKPKLIFTSSAAVYGAVTPAPQAVSAISQPCDIYGYSKMIGEHLVSSRYENYVIARLFNVFGDSDPIPHLIPSIVRQLGNGIIELGNVDSERDFVYVKDAAKAFTALSMKGKNKAVYNIGSGMCVSVESTARTIKKMAESKDQFVFHATERRKVDPAVLCADISDIVRDTGWRPIVTFEQGIKSVLDSSNNSLAYNPKIANGLSRNIKDYEAIISDFDDTILDNHAYLQTGLHELSREYALAEVGANMGIDFISQLTPTLSSQAIINAPTHTSEGAFWWLLCEMGFIARTEPFNPDHSLLVMLIQSKTKHYKQLLSTHAKEVNGALSFFNYLSKQGFENKLAIASSGCRGDIESFLHSHGFKDIFMSQYIFSCEDVTNFKPHPEVYKKALLSLRIEPRNYGRVLAFEDDPKGIIAAKQAGLTVCALTTRYTADQLMSQPVAPDFVAADFDEYANIFSIKNRNSLKAVTLSSVIQ